VARIRSIKPELLEDEKAAGLNHLEWRVFVSLFLLADDYGNFRAAPGRVSGAALWSHPGENVGAVLEHLRTVGLIRLYSVDGQLYGHLNGWEKHQKVDHPGKPSCPFPPATEDDSRESREGLAKVPETVAPDRKGMDRKGEERERTGANQADLIAAAPPVLVFPCAGEPAEWDLTSSQIATWADLFPGADVTSEAKKALAWVMASPKRKKTSRGMPSFLVGWLGRTQNSGGSRNTVHPSPGRSTAGAELLARQRAETNA
jgi:hypothetical protein